MVNEERPEETSQTQQAVATAMPPVEPPKKSNKKWWIIGGCGCLSLLILTGIVLAVITLIGIKSFQAPIAPIKGQLEVLNNGDINKAYNDYTSNEFKKATSLEQFKSIIDSNPQIFKSKSSSFTNVSIKNGFATVKGTITGQNGTKTKMTYILVKENNTWKIYNFNAT